MRDFRRDSWSVYHSGMRHTPESAAARTAVCLFRKLLPGVALLALAVGVVKAQSATDMPALKGLAPVTVLEKTPAGQAALAANYTVTGGIQTGTIRQATLLPFAVQQQQALEDAFITFGDIAQLADGLGTTLGGAYVARAHYLDRTQFTNLSPAMANVIAYSQLTAGLNSNAGKFFFANETTEGKTSVSAEAKEILKAEWRPRGHVRQKLWTSGGNGGSG